MTTRKNIHWGFLSSLPPIGLMSSARSDAAVPSPSSLPDVPVPPFTQAALIRRRILALILGMTLQGAGHEGAMGWKESSGATKSMLQLYADCITIHEWMQTYGYNYRSTWLCRNWVKKQLSIMYRQSSSSPLGLSR